MSPRTLTLGGPSAPALRDVLAWGESVGFGSCAFSDCRNLTAITATDAPILGSQEFDLKLSYSGSPRSLGVFGVSGSGKTTVLRVLMTLESIDDGVIYVDGDPLTQLDPSAQDGRRMHLGRSFGPRSEVVGHGVESPVAVLDDDRRGVGRNG